MDEIKFHNGGRFFIAYHKGNQKYDIYSGGLLLGIGVDLLLIKMLYDYCRGHAVPLILGQGQKDAKNALVWWDKLPALSKLTYSNEVFGHPSFGESPDLTEDDIILIWEKKA